MTVELVEVVRFDKEKLGVSQLRRIAGSQFVLFVCACFVALPSMLLTWVGLYCDPTCPEREIKTVSLFLNIPAVPFARQRSAATVS